jgi:hypothetical protein
MKTIRINDKGDEVKQLQEFLKKLGYSVTVDGNFGPLTEKLVREFQTKKSLKVDGIVGTKTWEMLKKEVLKLLEILIIEAFATQVVFDNSLSPQKTGIVNPKNIDVFCKAGGESNNPEIVITSTIRTPIEQATAMYNNEKSGNHISYTTPGRKVIEVYNANIQKQKTEVVHLMVVKIEELAEKGELVSKHCVPEAMYKSKNIIDISYIKAKNPRDFVNALLKFPEISKIITPLGDKNTYHNDPRVFIDTKEPAIHVEL